MIKLLEKKPIIAKFYNMNNSRVLRKIWVFKESLNTPDFLFWGKRGDPVLEICVDPESGS